MIQFISAGWVNAHKYRTYRPLSEPMMVRLPTHIYVTRPQWVNTFLQWVLFVPVFIYKIIQLCIVGSCLCLHRQLIDKTIMRIITATTRLEGIIKRRHYLSFFIFEGVWNECFCSIGSTPCVRSLLMYNSYLPVKGTSFRLRKYQFSKPSFSSSKIGTGGT